MKPVARRWLLLTAILLVCAASVYAQAAPGTMPGSITDAYRNSRGPAIAVFNRYAGGLFRALALVEMAWTAVLLLLERSDLQSWTAAMLRKLLVLFAFLYLVQNGPDFADRIISSFVSLGMEAAGLGAGHSPGDIFYRGVEIATILASRAALTGFLITPASTVSIMFAALFVFLAFTVVAIHYIMAVVESYIVVSAGLIFLAFGGNAVTRPYVERFFALAVGVGVKLMVLYMVIAIGNSLSASWNAVAENIAVSLFPFRDCFDLMGGALIFAAIAWGVPRFTAGLLSGSPSFSGGDIISIGISAVQAAMLVGGLSAAATRVAAAASTGSGAARLALAAGGTGGSGEGQGASSPRNGLSGAGGESSSAYAPQQPSPPAREGTGVSSSEPRHGHSGDGRRVSPPPLPPNNRRGD